MLEIVVTSPESDQYLSVPKEISKFPLMYMTGYFCRSVYVAKTKALISCAVTAELICTFVFSYTKN